uniref:Putative nuclear pore complex component n=1 Tax=Rhipicephalus microplus TaxID=6941 RepID=A0A6G4ZZX2_RHIMP
MAKRQATHELNADNWENEDEPEEQGQFKKADEKEIERRVIRTAKRSLTNTSASASPFGSFAGFGTPNTAKLPDATLPNGSAPTAAPEKEKQNADPVFLGKLKRLNECLLSWVKKHMESNPFSDFSPVFQDYERHLSDIRKSCASESETAKSSTSSLSTFKFATTISSSSTPFSFGQPPKDDAKSDTPASEPTNTFVFGNQAASTSSPLPKPTFTFGLSAVAPATSTPKNGSDDEEYVPPKEEIAPVEEKDAVYTKRCKLFQKKDSSYIERGVGNLYIKPHNDKYQLLIRADTRLGNILLNIMLAQSLPVSRLGKNNVGLVCIPNPPVNGKDDSESPTTMLLRVRTAEDADELKDALERYKGEKDS